MRLRILSLQVNVLGPFALTQQLRPLLQAAGAARIVTVASVMHRKAGLPSDLDRFFTCASVEHLHPSNVCRYHGAATPLHGFRGDSAVQSFDRPVVKILHCRWDLEAVQGCLLTMGRAAASAEVSVSQLQTWCSAAGNACMRT
jgi:NAD(P)-dependent dehydrogenase (short-subunit alcohol dehydrogenase family)